MSNWFERALATVAPGVASRRAAHRAQFEMLTGGKRAYEGASQGRRTDGWRTSSSSGDGELSAARAILIQRSRDLVRNNPHAAKIVTSHADNIIGSGIVPRAATGNPTLDETINNLFGQWTRCASIDGKHDYYGLQYLACRQMIEGGDVLARRVFVRDKLNASRPPEAQVSPVRLRVLEAEFLDSGKNGAVGTGKNIAINGVEIDGNSTPLAYWLFPQHPNASVTNSRLGRDSERVKATEVAHLYEAQRQQSRGAPWLSPVMIALKDLDEYNQAELVRKKIEACHVGIVSTEGEETAIGLAGDGEDPDTLVDSNGYPIDRFEPGMFGYLKPGRKITFNSPAISAGVEAYMRSQLRRIATGARLPYEFLTGDLSQANYSSNRMGIMQYRRFVEHVQWHIVIPQFCQPTWDWFIEGLRLLGIIPEDQVVGVEWSPPRHEQISPVEDVKADLIAVRAGFRSMPDVISSMGRSHAIVLKEIADWNAEIDSAGIMLDSDPRKVSINGQVQFGIGGEDGGGDAAGAVGATKNGKKNDAGKPA